MPFSKEISKVFQWKESMCIWINALYVIIPETNIALHFYGLSKRNLFNLSLKQVAKNIFLVFLSCLIKFLKNKDVKIKKMLI